ncbi:MAG: FlgO family outer membrane protein [Desulfurivibrionaceae bacterium]
MKNGVLLMTICGLGLLLAANVSCAVNSENDLLRVEKVGTPQEAEAAKNQPDTQAPVKKTTEELRRVVTGDNVYKSPPDRAKSKGTEILLAEMAQEVAGKVFYEMQGEGDMNVAARIAVVNGVPLSNLKLDTEFGRVVGEYLLTDLADRGLKVTELRMGKDITILPQTGEFILSRNTGELAIRTPEVEYVVVTTFANTRKTLIVQGRLVRLSDGAVKTSWRYSLPLNQELLALFQSSVPPYKIAVKGIGW